jgi:Protein of unknown function (DUF2442)
MILEVKKAKYLRDYSIEVEFDNGIKRIVDLASELDGEIFEPLKSLDYFKNFHIDCGTLSWQNGADIAPEYLFLISKPILDNEKLSEVENAMLVNVQKLYGLAS